MRAWPGTAWSTPQHLVDHSLSSPLARPVLYVTDMPQPVTHGRYELEHVHPTWIILPVGGFVSALVAPIVPAIVDEGSEAREVGVSGRADSREQRRGLYPCFQTAARFSALCACTPTHHSSVDAKTVTSTSDECSQYKMICFTVCSWCCFLQFSRSPFVFSNAHCPRCCSERRRTWNLQTFSTRTRI